MVLQPLAIGLAMGVALACAPRVKPLVGEIAAVSLPRGDLLPGHRQLVFEWSYSDPDMSGKGDGVARIAAPDSARLDFFLAGGFTGGLAVVVGDSIATPAADLSRRLIPPPALLWATLGRSAFPVTRDTAIRRDGDLLRADFGQPVEWRATFRHDSLVRVEHIDGGRIVEWVERRDDNRLEYRQETARRSLQLHITRVDDVPAFDPAIWHIDH